ncbi:MAG: response regulator transcription factor [Ignavibacteriaceae bacterium]
MEILIAEDEQQIADTLKKNFLDEGHHAIIAPDGEEALILVKKIKFDAILLDWKMPVVSGIEVCRLLRIQDKITPIILLTALDGVSNKVEALDAGADDYITKPFSFQEVLARINAVVRRSNLGREKIEFDNLVIDLLKRKVLNHRNEECHLTEKEFELFKYFLENIGEILNKDLLCEKVWELNFTPTTNICEATVKNLRKKLEEFTGKKYIKTIYGEGYILIEE